MCACATSIVLCYSIVFHRTLYKHSVCPGPFSSPFPLQPLPAEQVEDDDEVLLVMAEEIGGFVELVGGGDYAAILLEPLGSLAMVEETVVREKVRNDTLGV